VQVEGQLKKHEENKILDTKLERDIANLITRISECSVTEEDLQKVYRKDKLKQDIKDFKKKCKEEKIRLDEELERLKKKNEDLEKEEQATMLKAIEDKYNKEYEKLMERKKKIAEQNRQITALQRKIEN
jgi:DNA repair ATPase RecN